MKMEEKELRSLISEVLIGGRSIDTPLPNISETRVYLSTNTFPRDIAFSALIERRDRGIISESTAIKLWQESVNYELNCLISEGMMDGLKDAYEKVKGGAIKLKDNLSAAAKAALEKANDFLLEKTLQAMNLATSSLEGLMKGLSALSAAVDKFRDEHPILYKIVKILIFMLVIYGIMSLTSGNAQASVKMQGGGKMSPKMYETLRGALGEYGGKDIDKILKAGDAIKILDKAYHAKEAIPIEKLGSMNQAGLNMIEKLIMNARGGDSEAVKLLQQFAKVGKNLTVN